MKVDSSVVAVKPMRTAFKSKRNYAMRKAFDMIKSSPLSSNKLVEFDWNMPIRKVLVDKVPAFSQGKDDTIGSFLEPYANLVVP